MVWTDNDGLLSPKVSIETIAVYTLGYLPRGKFRYLVRPLYFDYVETVDEVNLIDRRSKLFPNLLRPKDVVNWLKTK